MARLSQQEFSERLVQVKLLLVDIDAVLTDGRIVLGDCGDELKFFDVQDGHGLVMMKRAGFRTVLLSGRKSKINERRAKDMRIDKVYQDVHDKLQAFEKILKKYKVSAEEVCYVGDDLIDIPVLKRVGAAVAVDNAVAEVKDIAHHVTARPGGKGAVREVCDLLLKAQGKWTEVTERYYR